MIDFDLPVMLVVVANSLLNDIKFLRVQFLVLIVYLCARFLSLISLERQL